MHRRVGRTAVLAAALLGTSLVMVLPAAPAAAAEPGDSLRFDTWTGYEVNRFPEEALAGDFDEDGSPDVAWVRNDFFENTLSVTLNLGEGTLDDPVEHPATESSKDGAVADLNGDDNLDVVVVGEGNGLDNTTVDLYLGDGDGAFTHTTATGGHAPRSVVAADLDADGDVDLATTNGWGADSVSVLVNSGDATFAPEIVHPVGEGPGGIVATDVDGDGDTDLVAASGGFSGDQLAVHLLLNDGDGAFTRTDRPVDGFQTAPMLATADFDGDGDADLVLGGIRGDSHVFLWNDGGLTFTETSVTGGFSSSDVEAHDLEGDGDVDVVSATFGSSSTGDITILRNAGDRSFSVETLTSSHQPMGLDLADFDLDGDPDIAAANRGSSLGVVHPGGAGGTFEQPAQQPLFAPPFKITTGDFDGDADTDVATSLQGSSAGQQVVQVLVNDGTGTLSTGATIPAGGRPFSVDAGDFDLDGDDDLVWELFGFSQPDVGVAFSNGDGTFTGATLIRENDCAPGQVTTADMDGDLDADIVMADEDGGDFATDCVFGASVTVIPSNGDGTFGDGVRVETEAIPHMAIGADVNGDGLNDVVSAHSSGNGGDLAVALNLGGLEFAPHVEIDTGRSHRELAAADLDLDSDVDIATVDMDDGITVFRNDGSGVGYDAAAYGGETVSGYLNAVAIDIGDVDVDGLPDIAAANWTGNDVGVWFNNGGGIYEPRALHYGMNTDLSDLALADFDGDGLLDVAVPNTAGNAGAAAATVGAAAVTEDDGGPEASAIRTDLTAAAAANGVSVALNEGNPQCSVRGGNGPDTLTGTPRADIICGFDGDDRIDGRGGNDVILAGNGNDTIVGGRGDDVIDAGAGKDSISAGDDDDLVITVDGGDRLDGGAGQDRLTAGTGNDRLVGGPGIDTLVGGKGDDSLNGGRGHDRCDGGLGRDQSYECEVRRNFP